MVDFPVNLECNLLAEGFIARIRFPEVNIDKQIRLEIELSATQEYGDYKFTTKSDKYSVYSIQDLRRLKTYFEEHLHRIDNGNYERAPYSFIHINFEFLIHTLEASIYEDEGSFGIQFFIDLAGSGALPHNFVGFHSEITLTNALAFLAEYKRILELIEDFLSNQFKFLR